MHLLLHVTEVGPPDLGGSIRLYETITFGGTLITLLIADDHAFFVQGVALSLANTDITVLKHLSSTDEIVNAYQSLKPDVLICDIMFGQGQEQNGLDVLKELLAKAPEAKVILLSQYDQDKMVKQAYKFGAKAFLSKSISRDELIKSIETVARGELYFTAENAIKIAKMTYDKTSDDIEDILSDKEIEVMTLLSDGHTEKEVAAKFGVSVKTIANIKASIKDKLNIERNASLTKLAIKYGLIDMNEFF